MLSIVFETFNFIQAVYRVLNIYQLNKNVFFQSICVEQFQIVNTI